ncbi:MAG: hypothetical protein HN348_09150 [Proteobacteria bacterium]|nr:hypothetical protein [Pseudomonadota bacterium]
MLLLALACVSILEMSPASGQGLEQDTAAPILDDAKPQQEESTTKQAVQTADATRCQDGETWVFEATSLAQTSGGILNLYQTGVVNPGAMGWDEEHDLDPVNVFRLRQHLSHTPSYRSVARNEYTLFDCTHESSLTFVVRLYDSKGALDDCRIWGHSSQLVFAGQHSRHSATSRANEIDPQNCHAPTKSNVLVQLPPPKEQAPPKEQLDEIWDTSDTGS